MRSAGPQPFLPLLDSGFVGSWLSLRIWSQSTAEERILYPDGRKPAKQDLFQPYVTSRAGKLRCIGRNSFKRDSRASCKSNVLHFNLGFILFNFCCFILNASMSTAWFIKYLD
jgi:hypothetical protein